MVTCKKWFLGFETKCIVTWPVKEAKSCNINYILLHTIHTSVVRIILVTHC